MTVTTLKIIFHINWMPEFLFDFLQKKIIENSYAAGEFLVDGIEKIRSTIITPDGVGNLAEYLKEIELNRYCYQATEKASSSTIIADSTQGLFNSKSVQQIYEQKTFDVQPYISSKPSYYLSNFGMFSSSTYQGQLADEWYDDNKINHLLRCYFPNEANSDLIILDALPLANGYGITAELIQNRLIAYFNPMINLYYLPLRINGNHWIGLYIDRTPSKPLIYWIDPYGNCSYARRTQICTLLNESGIFNIQLTLEHIHFQPLPLQQNGLDCGPWIVEIFRFIRSQGRFPGFDEINISACREAHEQAGEPIQLLCRS